MPDKRLSALPRVPLSDVPDMLPMAFSAPRLQPERHCYAPPGVYETSPSRPVASVATASISVVNAVSPWMQQR